MHLTKRTYVNPKIAWLIRLAAFGCGMQVCGLIAFLLIGKLQSNPGKIVDFYYSFIKGSFASEYKIWRFLKNVAILLCISLALTPAFRMRFWNIGGEGQTLVGVLAAIAVEFYLGGVIPDWSLRILMVIAALTAGAVWALIPAVFRSIWGTNETLFTLMMNYVAAFLVSFFLMIWVPNGSASLPAMEHETLPNIFWAQNPNDYRNDYLLIVLIAAALTAGLYVYLKYTKHGYEISVVGESVRTAQYVGISEKKVILRTMILSGAMCGLAGYLIACLDQTVTDVSAGGQGFTAIMVSWLGKFNPLAMLLTASLIEFLNQGAAQISSSFEVRGALPNVITGVMLFFIIGSEFFINYQLHIRRGKHDEVLKAAAEAGKEEQK